MKWLLIIIVFVVGCSVTTSCVDNNVSGNEAVAENRTLAYDYDGEVAILVRYLAVDPAAGSVYVDYSAASDDVEALLAGGIDSVSPEGRVRFQDTLDGFNRRLAEISSQPGVGQVIYNLYGNNVWVRTIDDNAPVSVDSVAIVKARLLCHAMPSLKVSHSINGAVDDSRSCIVSQLDANLVADDYYILKIDSCVTASPSAPVHPTTTVVAALGVSGTYRYTLSPRRGCMGKNWTVTTDLRHLFPHV